MTTPHQQGEPALMTEPATSAAQQTANIKAALAELEGAKSRRNSKPSVNTAMRRPAPEAGISRKSARQVLSLGPTQACGSVPA